MTAIEIIEALKKLPDDVEILDRLGDTIDRVEVHKYEVLNLNNGQKEIRQNVYFCAEEDKT